ncbi:insulinoma-associated protein 1a-like [Brachyhypopomus gauderio]|uniref:insulinoma-associated protein 1a-like n=1 Tax=Brachyhypopomus gauderio TaxID=698409 RepID=UPI0040431918
MLPGPAIDAWIAAICVLTDAQRAPSAFKRGPNKGQGVQCGQEPQSANYTGRSLLILIQTRTRAFQNPRHRVTNFNRTSAVTMPKGFLIKRSKKAGPVSYRVREEDDPSQAQNLLLNSGFPALSTPTLPSERNSVDQRTPSRVCFGGQPEAAFAPSLSPTRPDSEEYTDQYISSDTTDQKGNTGSPTQIELFLEPVLGSFAVSGSPVSPSLPEMTTKLDSAFRDPSSSVIKRPTSSNSKNKQSGSKKRRCSGSHPPEKRTNSRDEFTTSPVLGLRIKEDPEEDSKQRSSTSSPLGEFICQLCKERYSDPLTLAHHKCSRIVRVEYRCTECEKTFSCPANLASHRRWHKPKGVHSDDVAQGEDGHLSPTAGRSGMARPDPSPPPSLSDSGSDEEMPFSCPQCSKKFRRQAYLRKHLALHNRKAASSTQGLLSAEANKNSIGGARESSVLTKKESPDLSPKFPTAEQSSQMSGDVFPCRFCGDNFFSSPGLTRHINKYHPTETRQMILLSQTI